MMTLHLPLALAAAASANAVIEVILNPILRVEVMIHPYFTPR
jgi:hypothetical protein